MSAYVPISESGYLAPWSSHHANSARGSPCVRNVVVKPELVSANQHSIRNKRDRVTFISARSIAFGGCSCCLEDCEQNFTGRKVIFILCADTNFHVARVLPRLRI